MTGTDKYKMNVKACSCVLAMAALAPSGAALAQATTIGPGQPYPAKPVRMIVGFPAGGSVDLIARLIGQNLSQATGHAFIVDNRPGAHGIIGADLVSKAPPDGYTLLVVSSGHTVNPSLYKKIPYDTVGDFTALSCVARYPLMLLVHPSLPVKSVKELISVAKSRPSELNYASTGPGSPAHLTTELFLQATKTRMTHIPYKGGAPALIDLVSGQVSLMFNNILVGLPVVRRGQLHALAVTSTTRSAAVPKLPTMSEAGVPGFDATTWTGILAPHDLPGPLVTKLHEEIIRVLQAPSVQQRLHDDGAEIVGNTPAQFSQQIVSDIAKWAKVVKTAGVEPQ